ncbi:glycosyltransferase [Candidatus Gottesmanbacteria bacterium]|nr:glycosyltransferase [Candidatus Gottesmanbacteria bacterium]
MITNINRKPFFSIIILSSPGRNAAIFRCLDSVMKSTSKSFEVIVVDNGSTPKKEKRIRQEFPTAIYIDMKSNRGIEGFSRGFMQSTGKYILALDDDASILPDTLEVAHTRLRTLPKRIGVVGCNSYNPKTGQYYHEDYLKNPTRALYNQTIGGTLFKREIFSKSGYYDGKFFCWMHEDDLFIRIRNAGYFAIFDPLIKIRHFDNWSKVRKLMYYLMFRNFVWLTIKHFSLWYIPLLLIRDMMTLFFLPFKKGSLAPFFYGTAGYFVGICTISIPLGKRKVVTPIIQKEYVNYYVLNKFASITIQR